VQTRLAAPAGEVWDRISTFEGVNDELRPWMRMTAPAHIRRLDPSQVRPGERLFRSWILLLGVVPVDYDDITLVSVEPGRGFHERSSMLSMRVWEHERTLEAVGEGSCLVRDRVTFEPRVPGTAGLVRPVVAALFRHRHRRLERRFGRGRRMTAKPPS
jgi:ligand-binding SRPBCC domain-containing protein